MDKIEDFIDARDERCYTVFILPSVLADLTLAMYNHRGKRIAASFGAAVAAAMFLVKFRGLPLESLDIEADGKTIKIDFSHDFERVSITLPKCKQLLEKTRIFVGNIDKKIKKISCEHMPENAAVTECDDVDMFSDHNLADMLIGDADADFSVVFSCGSEEAKTKCFSPIPIPDLWLGSALASFTATGKRTEQIFSFNGEKLTLTPVYNGIRATLTCPKIMTFNTPYL